MGDLQSPWSSATSFMLSSLSEMHWQPVPMLTKRAHAIKKEVTPKFAQAIVEERAKAMARKAKEKSRKRPAVRAKIKSYNKIKWAAKSDTEKEADCKARWQRKKQQQNKDSEDPEVINGNVSTKKESYN